MRLHLKNERGAALFFTLLILFVLSVLGSVLISVSMTNFTSTRRGGDWNAAYYLADGAAEEILAEIRILTENAEFETLLEMEAYAASIGEAYAAVLIEDDPYPPETVHTYDMAGFRSDLAAKYREHYFSILSSGLQAVVSDLAFTPSFEPTLEEGFSLSVAFASPETILQDLENGSRVPIEVVGSCKGFRRKLRLEFLFSPPSYEFEVEGRESAMVLTGVTRNGTNPNFTLVSWKEANPNT